MPSPSEKATKHYAALKHFLAGLSQRSFLPVILLLGFGLRIYALGRKPLWYDEACSVAAALKNISYIFGLPHTLNYKGFYFVILKLWIALFGRTEYAARLLSVLFSTIAIYLVYRLARVLFDRAVALMSSFLLSISPFHIFHAQQLRYQSMMVALALTSYLALIKFLARPRMSSMVFSFLCNFFILYSHPYGILIILAQAVCVLAHVKTITRSFVFKWFLFQVGGGVFYLFVSFLPSAYYLNERIRWIPETSASFLKEFFFTLMHGSARYGLNDYAIPQEFLSAPRILSLFFFGISLSAAINFSKKANDRDTMPDRGGTGIIASWFFVPLAVVYAASLVRPVFSIKHLLFLLPPFLILSAKGFCSFKSRMVRVCLLAAAVMTAVLSVPLVYKDYFRVEWRSPASYISHNRKAGDAILIAATKEIIPFMYYFDYGSGDRLSALDIYGQWSGGTWENVLHYDDAVVVTIDDMSPISGIADPYGDFEEKFLVNRFAWRDRNIWIAASLWGRVGNFSQIEEKLSQTHLRVLTRELRGVILSYWKKR